MEKSYEWLKRIIDSCADSFHIECARKLIEFFKEQYGENDRYHELLSQIVGKEPMIMVV
jgi:predicted nuclease of restriction endonuclease-like RecB superfamily